MKVVLVLTLERTSGRNVAQSDVADAIADEVEKGLYPSFEVEGSSYEVTDVQFGDN